MIPTRMLVRAFLRVQDGNVDKVAWPGFRAHIFEQFPDELCVPTGLAPAVRVPGPARQRLPAEPVFSARPATR